MLGKLPMITLDDLPAIRQDYGSMELLESTLHDHPMVQFEAWFTQHLQIENATPNAMVLSTVDNHGHPDSRVVLLKELDNGAFVFYTHYNSVKGLQLDGNPYGALNFYWPKLMRQVRVRGVVQRVSQQKADEYFYSRPMASQLSAIASPQSSEISSRKALDDALARVIKEFADKKVIRPEHWGGYALIPDEVEFWQGRDNRLHDRIQYYRTKDRWCHRRLAP